jgi:transcription elongation factor Elf1
MTKLTDDLMFPIPCPHCGHEVQESLARIKDNPTIECPACSQTFQIASEPSVENTANKLDEIDRLLDGFGKL